MKTWGKVALALAVLLPAPLLADGGAKQRKPKREKKVFTEEDLGQAGRGNVTVSTPGEASTPGESTAPADASGQPGAVSGTPAAEQKTEPTEEERREQLRSELQTRIDEESEKVRVLKERVQQAQTELNDLTSYTFSTPDQPSGRRAALTKFLQDAAAEIKKAEEAMADAEEQARREGVRVSRP